MLEFVLGLGVVATAVVVLAAIDFAGSRIQGSPFILRELLSRKFWADWGGDWGRMLDSWAEQHRGVAR